MNPIHTPERAVSAASSLPPLTRRAMLRLLGAGAAWPMFVRESLGAEGAPLAVPPFKISLAEWSLHRAIRRKTIDHLEFAATARSLGIEAIEYVNTLFARGAEPGYVDEVKRRASGEGVASLLIMIDGCGMVGAETESERRKTLERHRPWMEAAASLGCHSVRVNAGSRGSYEEQQERAAAGLRLLCESAAPLGLNVLVENHGGWSSNADWLVGVMKRVDHPRCGTLPDFGNFRVSQDEFYDPYVGVRKLMPYAKAVSAKAYGWGEGPTTVTSRGGRDFDFARLLDIVVDAGYHGYVGIEYEGGGDEMEGIRRTKEVMEAIRERMEADG